METSDSIPTNSADQGVRIRPALLMSAVVGISVAMASNSQYYAIAAGSVMFALTMISLQLEKIIALLTNK